MPYKLCIAALGLGLFGCSALKVIAPPPELQICPPVAPQLPCDDTGAQPTTLSELRKAWLVAQKNAEDCKALADAWHEWWQSCGDPGK